MSSRAAVHQLIQARLAPGQALAELGFQAVYASNAVDTAPEQKFLVVRWEEQQRAYGAVGKQRVTVWVHSRGRDYGPLDNALRIIQADLTGAVHLLGADGWRLTQADWMGDSNDLYDDGFGTITKNSGYDVVSRYDTH